MQASNAASQLATAPTVHLLEPYRSALLSMGYDEGLVFIDGDGARHSQSLQAGRRPELRSDVLQLLLLFGEASIAWTETSTTPELAHLEMLHKHGLGLQTAGVAHLLRDPDLENVAAAALKGARSLADVWSPFAGDVAAFAPVIASQLAARGKSVSEQFIHFVLAVRLGDSESARKLAQGLDSGERQAVHDIQDESLPAVLRYDMPVLSELHQCMFAAKRANEHNSTIAGPAIGVPTSLKRPIGETVGAARQLLAIVAEELLQQDLSLPVPGTLREAVEFRARQEIAEFRSVFFPWLSRLLEDGSAEESRLRREVRAMLRAARWGPRVRRLSRFVQYVGIANDFADAATGGGPRGLGLVITAVGKGAEKLAARFESKSRWLLCASAGAEQVGTR